jgi:hypothetical protein
MRTQALLFSVALLAGLAPAGGAEATSRRAIRTCVAEASLELRECKAPCQEGKQAASDLCLRRDHECVEVCRAERESCRDDTGLEDALALCRAALEEARQQCRATTPPDTPERDACIDAAQVAAFRCRDAAREIGRPLLRDCRRAFGTCARACAPPDPAEPPPDLRQCRSDAAHAANACRAVCQEDFQLAKDACKGRDHECVEECRADRAACVAPIQEQLDAAVAACRAAREQGVADCRALHAPDSPELDACIDEVQVQAFECRDAARELARPQFETCRAAFRACVTLCPAPPAQ